MDLSFPNRASRRRATSPAGCSRAVPVGPRRLGRAVVGVSAIGLAALGSITVAGPAGADTYTVTSAADSGSDTLRAAIEQANANTGVIDVITVAPSVTQITLSSALPQITEPVTITGPGSAALELDLDGQSTGFDVNTGTTADPVTITGVTVTGGAASDDGGAIVVNGSSLVLDDVVLTGNTATGRGGGLFAYSSDVSLTDSSVTGNTATNNQGGGLYAKSGDLSLTRTTVTGNTSGSNGAGVYVYGGSAVLTVTDSELTGNESGNRGGGLYIGGGVDAAISGTTVSGNTANDGAGIYDYGSALDLSDSTVSGNTADSDGGGFYFWQAQDVTLTDVSVTGNEATGGSGGGLYAGQTPQIGITGSTFSGNSADFLGAALYFQEDSGLTMSNSTVSGNTSTGSALDLGYAYDESVPVITLDHVTVAGNDTSSAVHLWDATDATITDSVLTGTDIGDDLVDDQGTVAVTYSLVHASALVTDGVDGNLTGVDPQLGALADNGGPTLTMLPGSGSPVLDAGDPAYAGSATDQRGDARVAASAAGSPVRTDMGAVEAFMAPVVVPVDGGGGSTPQPVAPVAAPVAAPADVAGDATLAYTGAATHGLLPAGVGLVAVGGLLGALGFRRRRTAG